MLGLACFGIAMWTYSLVTHDWGSDQFLLPQILRGLPQVFAIAPSVTLGLGSLPPERLKYASGLFNMMAQSGRRGRYCRLRRHRQHPYQFSFFRDCIEPHPANGAMTRLVDTLGVRYAANPAAQHAGHVVALKRLWLLAYREASTLAYADAFRAVMIAFIFATLLVPLMRNVAPSKAPATPSH